jgi:KaiC/GvpD/RAD55 family RecA-like ATPase
MQNKLTVVTGPPGTGKSQLVLNLIANAIVNDKSVLFASKIIKLWMLFIIAYLNS